VCYDENGVEATECPPMLLLMLLGLRIL
jgi:hypothetical protein